MTTTRLTRKEQQARTRVALLESAGKVLAEKGLHRASIDDITADAGFTKGAFYANFEGKEALFLAMLDEHFAERIAAVERLFSGQEEILDRAANAGRDFTDSLRANPAWCRLFLEFTSHATRDAAFRSEFIARNTALRERMTEIFARRAQEAGVVLAIPASKIARMVFAMAHGVAIDGLLDDDAGPDLFGDMLRALLSGLVSPPVDG
ncbi:MAG: TetR/AcrR family transcriptional regulator [Solirubrobacteraceae bacterium]|nr:TetR/AcrR family transcriptional regulator [Solirubrobacteraceae bacterium]